MHPGLSHSILTARTLALVVALALVTLAAPRDARAHGIWGHVHVTGWAIENLPPGELRDFFDHPEVFNAALFGAAFTDSGYWPQGGAMQPIQRAYGEHTHWEPFIEDAIQWLLVNDPPPFRDLESRKRVAFLMGCAAHGLQDEIFDSLFLYFADAEDQRGQDDVDPASDGFLVIDGYLRHFPEPYVPYDMLLPIYEPVIDGVTREAIEGAVATMVGIYVNQRIGPNVARRNGEQYIETLPWTRAYHMDDRIPGSLRAEIVPTGRYLQAIWDRLHGRFGPDDVVTWTFPAPGRHLVGGRADHPESWVTYVFGVGVRGANVESVLLSAVGDELAAPARGTRWGGFRDWGRLAVLRPADDLPAGSTWTAMITSGLSFIDGTEARHPFVWEFAVACEDGDDDCPDVGVPDEVCVLPTEPGCEWLVPPSDDVGPGDDADAGMPGDDAGADPLDPSPDAGPVPTPDSGLDSGSDSGSDITPDTTAPDADVAADATDGADGPDGDGDPGTAAPRRASSGCAATSPSSQPGLALLLALAVLGRRRSAVRRRPTA